MVSDGWTPELLGRAKAAYKFLFQHGNIKRTLQQMDEKDASRCLAQIQQRRDAIGERHRAGQELSATTTQTIDLPRQPTCTTAP